MRGPVSVAFARYADDLTPMYPTLCRADTGLKRAPCCATTPARSRGKNGFFFPPPQFAHLPGRVGGGSRETMRPEAMRLGVQAAVLAACGAGLSAARRLLTRPVHPLVAAHAELCRAIPVLAADLTPLAECSVPSDLEGCSRCSTRSSASTPRPRPARNGRSRVLSAVLRHAEMLADRSLDARDAMRLREDVVLLLHCHLENLRTTIPSRARKDTRPARILVPLSVLFFFVRFAPRLRRCCLCHSSLSPSPTISPRHTQKKKQTGKGEGRGKEKLRRQRIVRRRWTPPRSARRGRRSSVLRARRPRGREAIAVEALLVHPSVAVQQGERCASAAKTMRSM